MFAQTATLKQHQTILSLSPLNPKNHSNGAKATIKAVGSSAQIVKPDIVCGKGLMQDINAVLLPLAVPAPRRNDDRRRR